jgi:hypothetical protein
MSIYTTLTISREKALELYYKLLPVPTNDELGEYFSDLEVVE